MEKPSMEWIDKLFLCMTDFYQERWTRQFDRWLPEPLFKAQWQSALQGLTHDEIRGVLLLLRQAAKSPAALPPSHLEFYNFAKGTAKPFIANQKIPANRGNSAIARRCLDEINAKLRNKKIGCST